MTKTVGVIGLGLMGSALSKRLLDAGFTVVGFDVDAAKRSALAKLGGEPMEAISDVAARCSQALIAVMTMAQVEQVVEGPGGLIEAGDPKVRRIAMCTSTCDPAGIEALTARASKHGLAFLDTPVSGTSQQVLRGDGYGMIAGDKAAAEAAEPVLAAVYPRHQFVGPSGAATKTKLAVNHILGLNRVALAEGLVFA